MFFVYNFSAILLFVESLFVLFASLCNGTLDGDEGQNGSQKYRVEGTVSIPFIVDQSWTASTRVIVDGGQRLAFLRLMQIDFGNHKFALTKTAFLHLAMCGVDITTCLLIILVIIYL